MRIAHADDRVAKGWYVGPWNAGLAVAVGYAHQGINEPHLHRTMTEIYMVARGSAQVRVEQQTVTLNKKDVLVIAPGEAHTFLSTSPDYFHFVIQSPALQGEAARDDKLTVARTRLGLDA